MTTDHLLGLEFDRLSLKQRLALAGKWIALERYDPRTLPERRIQAVGDTPENCWNHLRARGLQAADYEVSMMLPPY